MTGKIDRLTCHGNLKDTHPPNAKRSKVVNNAFNKAGCLLGRGLWQPFSATDPSLKKTCPHLSPSAATNHPEKRILTEERTMNMSWEMEAYHQAVWRKPVIQAR